MAGFLKANTAVSVTIGPYVDSTDGATVETGLSLPQAELQLSKADGAFAQKNDATAATHKLGGHYSCSFNATDTNTIGILRLESNVSGALPVWEEWQVVKEEIYDALFASDADAFDASGQVTVGAMGAGVITAAAIATDAIGSDEIAASAVNEIQAGLATATDLATVDTIVDAIKVVTDQLVAARGEPAGVPAVNEDPLTKLDYLFMALRNQVTVTATKKTFFDDGGSAEWEKDLTDDGNTFTETEANAI